MKYLKAAKIDFENDIIYIPNLDCERIHSFKLTEEDSWESMIKNHCGTTLGCEWKLMHIEEFKLWRNKDIDDDEDFIVEVYSYEITDIDGNDLFLISLQDLGHCNFSFSLGICCTDRNKINLLRFYREEILPFNDKTCDFL